MLSLSIAGRERCIFVSVLIVTLNSTFVVLTEATLTHSSPIKGAGGLAFRPDGEDQMFLNRAAWSIITAVVVWSFSVATAATQEASKNNQIAKEQQKAYAYGRKEMKEEFDRALAKWKELLKEQLKDNYR
jgi:hypothetical protein